MANHQATWVRLRELARERFLDVMLAAKIAAREAFNTEETTVYTADLDVQVKEQVILEAAHATTRLREELRQELREEGSGAGGNEDENDDYVHLDNDDLDADFLADLPTVVEAATKQRRR